MIKVCGAVPSPGDAVRGSGGIVGGPSSLQDQRSWDLEGQNDVFGGLPGCAKQPPLRFESVILALALAEDANDTALVRQLDKFGSEDTMLEYPDPPDYGDEEPQPPAPGMSDKETADTIRKWCSRPRSQWGWPTDPCGYEQHVRFVEHRNKNLKTGDDFNAFALAYADSLDPPTGGNQDAEGHAVTPSASAAQK